MRERDAAKMYRRELFGALAVYTAILFLAMYVGRRMDEGLARTLVLVSPMIGFMLAGWAIARHLRRIDEYMRMLVLEGLAIAAGVTAGLSFTYGFLEGAGYPKLSMFSVWPVMGAVWGVVCMVRYYRDRR